MRDQVPVHKTDMIHVHLSRQPFMYITTPFAYITLRLYSVSSAVRSFFPDASRLLRSSGNASCDDRLDLMLAFSAGKSILKLARHFILLKKAR